MPQNEDWHSVRVDITHSNSAGFHAVLIPCQDTDTGLDWTLYDHKDKVLAGGSADCKDREKTVKAVMTICKDKIESLCGTFKIQ